MCACIPREHEPSLPNNFVITVSRPRGRRQENLVGSVITICRSEPDRLSRILAARGLRVLRGLRTILESRNDLAAVIFDGPTLCRNPGFLG